MIKKFNKWIRNNFGFSRSETNGFMVILMVMLISILAPFIYKSTVPDSAVGPTDQLRLDSLIAQLEGSRAEILKRSNDSLVTFDPNDASLQELKRLGLSNFICENIIKYRKSGGSSKNKESLLNIYGMNDSIFEAVRPFIDLPNQMTTLQKPITKVKGPLPDKPIKGEKEIAVFDINFADTSDLKRIKGIGAILLSNRVEKYRNLLGGFYSKDQIMRFTI